MKSQDDTKEGQNGAIEALSVAGMGDSVGVGGSGNAVGGPGNTVGAGGAVGWGSAVGSVVDVMA